ncbi:MAG: hypothetical protein WDN04_14965 [Rhodospirillales bacterium]
MANIDELRTIVATMEARLASLQGAPPGDPSNSRSIELTSRLLPWARNALAMLEAATLSTEPKVSLLMRDLYATGAGPKSGAFLHWLEDDFPTAFASMRRGADIEQLFKDAWPAAKNVTAEIEQETAGLAPGETTSPRIEELLAVVEDNNLIGSMVTLRDGLQAWRNDDLPVARETFEHGARLWDATLAAASRAQPIVAELAALTGQQPLTFVLADFPELLAWRAAVETLLDRTTKT